MREFVFKDGGSDKFWRIELGGLSFDVTFGKAGSKGQTQQKTFASAAEAQKAHDALIAEKLRKGYTEIGASGAGKAASAKPIATAKPATAKAAAATKPAATVKPAKSAASTNEATPAAAYAGERRIDLDPLDWHWAAWRGLPPPELPTRPFDQDDCIARLAKVKKHSYLEQFVFERAGIRPHMSKEEARFWWACMASADTTKPARSVGEAAAKKKLPPVTMKKAIDALAHARATYEGVEMGWVLGALFEPMEVLTEIVLADKLPGSGGHRGPGEIFYGLRETAFLRLSSAERRALRERIRPEITAAKLSTDPYDVPGGAFLLAPLVGGLDKELGAIIRGWKDDEFYKEAWDDAYRIPQHLVLGLGNAEDVAHEMRRLKLTLRQPEYLRGYLAHTEYAALDHVAYTVIAQTNKQVAARLAELACIVHAPEMVAPMQAIVKRSKAPQVAAKWLEEHASYGASAGAGPSTASVRGASKPTGPAIEGEEELLEALARSTFEAPDPRLAALKKKNDPAALDALGWALFERWLVEGAPPKTRWMMTALGFLGGDATAHKLAPLVRAWPGESQHKRAVLGLECLRAIGTDVALMQLSGIALKVKFQALKQRAEACMDEIADARGMTRDELEDRIVPDGGFDADGKRTFSFGPRAFTATIGPSGAPALRDDGGAVREDLPKPGAKDDAAAAKSATEAWKVFKKTLRDAVKIQSERLERAMVTQRGWSAADFQTLIVAHPLMGHLARLVLWATFDGEVMKKPFRVAEDRSFADVDDAPLTVPKGATVRLVHVLSLDAKTIARWSQVFADYEIVAPFPQLGRSTFALDAKEAKSDDLGERFAGKTYDVRSFQSRLRKAGWKHGSPEDGGHVGEHTKPFPGANVVAVVEHNGFPIGAPEYADPQKIEHVRFVRPGDAGYKRKHLAAGTIDRVVVSEVLHDLAGLEG